MDQLYDTFLGTWPRATWVFCTQMKGLETLICLATKILKIRPKLRELWPQQSKYPELLSKVSKSNPIQGVNQI